MAIAADMKRLAEDITESFNTRVSDIATLVENTHQMLSDFEGHRIKDFKSLHKEIRTGLKERQSEVGSMLGSFRKWNVETAKALKSMLKRNRVAREKEVAGFLGEVRADMKDASNTWNRMHVDISRRKKGNAGAGKKQKTRKAGKESE